VARLHNLDFASSTMSHSAAQRVRTQITALRAKVPSKTPEGTMPKPTRPKVGAVPVPEQVAKHRAAMKEAFPDGWNPPRKISREAMDGLRALHAHNPEQFSTPVLANKFKISPEAVRRILKSRWVPTEDRRSEMEGRERRLRAEKRLAQRNREYSETQNVLRRDIDSDENTIPSPKPHTPTTAKA
jgi:hypothetical protein